MVYPHGYTWWPQTCQEHVTFVSSSIDFSQNWAITRKQQNRQKMDLRDACRRQFGTLDLDHVKVIFCYFIALKLSKLGHTSKMADCRARRMKIWAPTGIWCMHLGTFDLKMSGSFGGHSVQFCQHWVIAQKQLIIEQNGQTLGFVGIHVCGMDVGSFDLEYAWLWGHSVPFLNIWP